MQVGRYFFYVSTTEAKLKPTNDKAFLVRRLTAAWNIKRCSFSDKYKTLVNSSGYIFNTGIFSYDKDHLASQNPLRSNFQFLYHLITKMIFSITKYGYFYYPQARLRRLSSYFHIWEKISAEVIYKPYHNFHLKKILLFIYRFNYICMPLYFLFSY